MDEDMRAYYKGYFTSKYMEKRKGGELQMFTAGNFAAL